jgi:hypothetical protein
MATLGKLSPERPSDKDYAIIWYLQILIQHGGQCNMYTMHGKNNPPNSNDIIWAQDYLRGQGYIRHLPNQIGVTYQIVEPDGRRFFNKKVYDKVLEVIANAKWFTKVSSVLEDIHIDDSDGTFAKALTRQIKNNYETTGIEEDDSIMLTEDAKDEYHGSKHDFGEENPTPAFQYNDNRSSDTFNFKDSVVGNLNTGKAENQSSSFDKSFNADANSNAPIKKSKIDWPLILKIIAGIIAIVVATLKACNVI